MLAVGQRRDVLCWRQQSGVFSAIGRPEQLVRVGVPGLADAGLIVAVKITPEMVGKTIGAALQAEFKTATGRQREAQENMQRAVEARGGVYRVIRSADDMLDAVEDMQRGRAW
jgi:hypothetical protein